MKKNKNFTITNTTNGKLPIEELPFCSIKDKVLGKDYELSLVFIDHKKSQELNKKYRSKDYPTNVLSFPLEEKTGEIYICVEKVQDESQGFGLSFYEYSLYLFIHGVFHLNGFDHSDLMEEKEQEIRNMFNVPSPSQ